MKASELNVAALTYLVTEEVIAGLHIAAGQPPTRFEVGSPVELFPRIEALRDELRSPRILARGSVPRLREFASDWGRRLVPEAVLAALPDVLVIVPHAALHDLPIHVVRVGDPPAPLGTRTGISYASSQTLFLRCVSRNPARKRDVRRWTFDENGAPRGHTRPRRMVGGGADVLTSRHEDFLALVQQLVPFVDAKTSTIFDTSFPFTRDAVKAAWRPTLAPSDVLCVAAHGYVDPENHRMSGLMLQRGPGISLRPIPLHGGRYFDFRDLPLRGIPAGVRLAPDAPVELLTAAELEIDALLETHLVALLGCSAGRGRVSQGDEPASLAETFLHIGAPSVIAPMWDADLTATREWIREFFSGWVERGYPKALAARYASQRMHASSGGDSPQKDGALTLRGDWL
jgi:hypothetical protein